MIRILLALLVGIVAGLFEVGFSTFLPGWAEVLPLLPLVALFMISSSPSRAYAAIIGGGLILEAYQVASPDLPMIRLFCVTMLMDFAARRFLTNRSVYATAALALLGRFTAWILSLLVTGVAVAVGFDDRVWDPASFPLAPMGWDIVLTSAGFLCVAFFTGRFVGFGNRYRSGSRL